MKRVLLKSVFDAFDYVLDHYVPFGLENEPHADDTYAVISIQDASVEGGFGVVFTETRYCLDVLTLYFDDVEAPAPGSVLFSEEDAEEIIDFLLKNRDAHTLLVHCYAGQSRSRAVAAFAVKLFGGDNARYFETGVPNRHVYETLLSVWERTKDRR